MNSTFDRLTFIKQIIAASLILSMMSFAQESEKKPNILIILADDMGFSDIGCYGGEINTPNIDNLAENGMRFMQFYNTARCSPTRASLLTGLYPHQAGMAKLATTEPTEPGPEQGWLNAQCVTIPELLKTAGYRTLMSGKWHVGEERPNWPVDRGFDRFFGLIGGTATYWDLTNGMKMALDDQIWAPDPADVDAGNFYLTDTFTDYALGFLDEHKQQHNDQPFFMYLTYTAPHWPLHAPQEDIEKYKDRYTEGWDVLRQERYERMKNMGLISDSWQLSDRKLSDWNNRGLPAWDTLDDDEKQYQSEIMAVYAAMIDRMDQNIGRVLEQLKADGLMDNTLIMFLSDNGASAENPKWAERNELTVDPDAPLGSRFSFSWTGPGWANASNTPLRYFKLYNHEGGISTPFIAQWPQGISASNTLVDRPAHVIDIMATCLDLAGLNYPQQFNENAITPLEGISLFPLFQGQQGNEHDAIYFEHVGNAGMIKGDWKISLHKRVKKWELYNLANDRCELHDLADVHPGELNSMGTSWLNWAEKVGVEIKSYMRDIPTSIEFKDSQNNALNFKLYTNYPNPFNPTTTIKFAIPEQGSARLSIYNLLGQEVAVLVNSDMNAGSYSVDFNSVEFNLASGIYIYRLAASDNVLTKKLVLLK
ncbi:MAG: sulfatase-like hydrolase/transferase [Melioribacteraceae bacterium]|nr:sulfatase-like hydrolase/transferase [Melioribacteraceae bacterium]